MEYTPNLNFIKQEINFDSIDSTQIYARKFIEEKQPTDCVLITADEQTGGIGRYTRKWCSPKGLNVYSSFIIPLNYLKNFSKSKSNLLPFLPFVTCVSVSQTLEKFNCEPKLKWVNDVLLDDKKVSGALIESISEAENLYVIIGIGLNVNMDEEHLKGIDQPATSMKIAKGRKSDFDIASVVNTLKKILGDNLTQFDQIGKEFFIEYYNRRLAYKDCKVKIVDKNEREQVGILKGTDEDGHLLLQNEDEGEISTIYDGRLFKF